MHQVSMVILILVKFVCINSMSYFLYQHISEGEYPKSSLSGDGTLMISSSPKGSLYNLNPTNNMFQSAIPYTSQAANDIFIAFLSKDKTTLIEYDSIDQIFYTYRFDGTNYNFIQTLNTGAFTFYNIYSTLISSDGSWIIIIAQNVNIAFYKWNSVGSTYDDAIVQTPGGMIYRIEFAHDESSLFAVSNSPNLYRYQNNGNQYILQNTIPVASSSFGFKVSNNGSFVLMTNSDDDFQIFSFILDPPTFTSIFKDNTTLFSEIDMTDDMNIVIVKSFVNTWIYQFNGTQYNLLQRIIDSKLTSIIDISPDGKTIITCDQFSIRIYLRCDVSNCQQCSSFDFCSNCLTGFTLQENGTCSCSGYIDQGKCFSCPLNCIQCSSSTCISCKTGFESNQDGSCICFGFDTNEGCSPCSNNCLSIDNCTTCISCNTGFIRGTDGMCQCSGFVDQGVCYPCLQNCAECTNNSTCIACQENYTMMETSGQCLGAQGLTWWEIMLIVLGGTLSITLIVLLSIVTFKWYKLKAKILENKEIDDKSNLSVPKQNITHSKIMFCEPEQQVQNPSFSNQHKTEQQLNQQKEVAVKEYKQTNQLQPKKRKKRTRLNIQDIVQREH